MVNTPPTDKPEEITIKELIADIRQGKKWIPLIATPATHAIASCIRDYTDLPDGGLSKEGSKKIMTALTQLDALVVSEQESKKLVDEYARAVEWQLVVAHQAYQQNQEST